MEAEWYVFTDGRQTGPYTEQDLVNARDDMLVWREGMSEWAPKAAVFPKAPARDLHRPPAPPIPSPPRAASERGAPTARVPASPGTRPSEKAATPRDASGALGIAALVIGIVALINGCIPFCGAWAILPALVGLVLGVVALVLRIKSKRPRAISIAGVALNSLAVVAVCVLAVAFKRAEAFHHTSADQQAVASMAASTSSASAPNEDEIRGAAIETFLNPVVSAILGGLTEEITPLLSPQAQARWSSSDLKRLSTIAVSSMKTPDENAKVSATQTAVDNTDDGTRVTLSVRVGETLVGTLRITIARRGDGLSPGDYTVSDIDLSDARGARLWPVSAEEYRSRIAASTVDAKALWREYEENEVRADGQYKGRSLFVSGKIQSIEKDFLDNVLLQLRSPNEFMPTRAYLNEHERVNASRLSKGDEILLNCVGDGRVMGSPVLRGCTIQ